MVVSSRYKSFQITSLYPTSSLTGTRRTDLDPPLFSVLYRNKCRNPGVKGNARSGSAGSDAVVETFPISTAGQRQFPRELSNPWRRRDEAPAATKFRSKVAFLFDRRRDAISTASTDNDDDDERRSRSVLARFDAGGQPARQWHGGRAHRLPPARFALIHHQSSIADKADRWQSTSMCVRMESVTSWGTDLKTPTEHFQAKNGKHTFYRGF